MRILAVIRTLPETYQETLILRLVEGMTGPEIAEQTGLTPESVRVNLHRSMQQIRERLGLEKNEFTPRTDPSPSAHLRPSGMGWRV